MTVHVILMGDNDIDYVSAFGPYQSKEGAENAIDEGTRLHPGYDLAVDESGENKVRIVALGSTADLHRQMGEMA